MTNRPSKPLDVNQLAAAIVAQATCDVPKVNPSNMNAKVPAKRRCEAKKKKSPQRKK